MPHLEPQSSQKTDGSEASSSEKNKEIRLSVFLSKASVASRRGAEKMIQEGRVSVNGNTVTKPETRVLFGRDHVKVDGKLIHKLAPFVYLALNKPVGYVTTAKDPQGRKTVFDLLKRVKIVVEPVGRLDFDSEGLLIFTNDGDLTNKLTNPRYKVPKTYRIKVAGIPETESLTKLRQGVRLDKRKTKPAKIKRIKRTDNYTWFRITIYEGKYRQVRRMFKSIGHTVVRLKREKFGPVQLEDIKPGRFRYLRQDEIDQLRKAIM